MGESGNTYWKRVLESDVAQDEAGEGWIEASERSEVRGV